MSNARLTVEQWHHLAVVVEGHEVRLYVDGELDTTASNVPNIIHNSESLTIGGDLPGNVEFFDGQIGEVRLWTVARSATDIRATKDVRLNGDEPGLALYQPLPRPGQ